MCCGPRNSDCWGTRQVKKKRKKRGLTGRVLSRVNTDQLSLGIAYRSNDDIWRSEIELDSGRSGSAATHFTGDLSDNRDVGDVQSVTFVTCVTYVTLCPVAAEPHLQ